MAPAKAPTEIADNPSNRPPAVNIEPNTITTLAPTEAPAETPINAGSAKGLRNRPCNRAPQVASSAPTSRERITLGSRIISIISFSWLLPPSPLRVMETISASEINTGPVISPSRDTNGSAISNSSPQSLGVISRVFKTFTQHTQQRLVNRQSTP